MKRPRRNDNKYWTGTTGFNHLCYEDDLEDYINFLKTKDVDQCEHPLKELKFWNTSEVECKLCGYKSLTF